MNIWEKAKQFVLDNILISFLALIGFISIMVLFISLGGTSDSDKTKTTTSSINKEATTLRDLNLPIKETDKIYESVKKIAKKNDAQGDLSKEDIKIRKKSLRTKTFRDYDLLYVNFIIDLPEDKQSYHVSHEWSTKENNDYLSDSFSALVFCIRDESQLKYKKFACKDGRKEDPKYDIIKNYARFDATDDLEIMVSQDDKTKIIASSFRLNNETDQMLIDRGTKWINSLGFTTEGLTIVASTSGGGVSEE